ncbi:hypothetical protein SmJEL517_g02149 [Synchytrium microbalum]|uniref:Uncharacterized protein n=1 Tax=Synchytrium microbalum TaxID=1806994 RepID=A0A507CDF5_9FUNG|nr:uncharacterized protein SmJEL517_g02149 [Synchytrium microbalum]TPX35573.1 hypothetical protein SmJEL517_g02149 [Synchytrium microbalum]
MSRPPQSVNDDVMSLLDSLTGELPPSAASTNNGNTAVPTEDVLAFLDELTQTSTSQPMKSSYNSYSSQPPPPSSQGSRPPTVSNVGSTLPGPPMISNVGLGSSTPASFPAVSIGSSLAAPPPATKVQASSAPIPFGGGPLRDTSTRSPQPQQQQLQPPPATSMKSSLVPATVTAASTNEDGLSTPLAAPTFSTTRSKHYPVHPTLQAAQPSGNVNHPLNNINIQRPDERIIPQQQQPPQQQQSNWTWDSFVNTARAQAASVSASVSTISAQTFDKVAQVAETSIKTISANDTVKQLNTGVASLNLSRLASTVSNTLAPSTHSNEHGNGTGDLALFPTVMLWFCAKTADHDIDQLHEYIQGTVNELWLSRAPGVARVCNKVVVNSVKDKDPRMANSLELAITWTQETLVRLKKLAETHTSQTPATTAQPPHHLFLIIQPFTIQVGTKRHLQHYIVIMDEDELINLVSQSVSDEGHDKSLEKWASVQRGRVVEGSVADLCEEYAVRCLGDSVGAASVPVNMGLSSIATGSPNAGGGSPNMKMQQL